MAEKPHCETCKYWRFVDGDFGKCQRYPPVLNVAQMDPAEAALDDAPWYFPITIGDQHWCGEYQREEGKKTLAECRLLRVEE